MGHGVQGSERRVHGILLAQEEEPEADPKKVRPGASQRTLHRLSLQQRLEDGLSDVVVTCGDEDESEAHGGHSGALDGARRVHDHWSHSFQEVLPT